MRDEQGIPSETCRLSVISGRGIVQLSGPLDHFDGLALPRSPSACTARSGMVAAWTGPHKWLLIGSRTDVARWLSVSDPAAVLVDLSHARTIVRACGDWMSLLRRSCPLDTDRALPMGLWSCAQSLLDDIPAFILTPPNHGWIEMYVPRSFGDSLRERLGAGSEIIPATPLGATSVDSDHGAVVQRV